MADAAEPWQDTRVGKAVAAGALVRDPSGRVLLVEPTYKPTWEIPGGIVEAGESPRSGCARELREELGVDLPVGRLLCVEWQPTRPGRREAVLFVDDGGVLAAGTRLRLPAAELASARFVDPATVEDLTSASLARRVRAGLAALAEGRVVELEAGHAQPPQ